MPRFTVRNLLRNIRNDKTTGMTDIPVVLFWNKKGVSKDFGRVTEGEKAEKKAGKGRFHRKIPLSV